MDQPLVRFVCQSEAKNGDCSIASLAMLLGLTYSEALVLVARVNPRVLTLGASWNNLKAAVRRYRKPNGDQVRLVQLRAFSLDDDSSDAGILGIHMPDGTQHAVYLKRGLIFDGRSEMIWDADVYLKVQNAEAVSLLVVER